MIIFVSDFWHEAAALSGALMCDVLLGADFTAFLRAFAARFGATFAMLVVVLGAFRRAGVADFRAERAELCVEF